MNPRSEQTGRGSPWRKTATRFFCGFALLICAAGLAQQDQSAPEPGAEPAPPVSATVYYSKDDPRWPETEKAIEAVHEKFPRFEFKTVSIDTPEGYAQLLAAEKALNIKQTGDVTLVMGPLFLTSEGDRRDIEKYLGAMVGQILNPTEKKGWVKTDAAPFAQEVFGKNAQLELQPQDSQNIGAWYRVKKDGKAAGWVVDVFRKIACPVCTDTQFLVAIGSPELRILDVRPVRPIERLGLPVEAKETGPFLNQFKDRGAQQPDQRVDIVSGATKTSRSYEAAISEVLKELKRRETGGGAEHE